MTQLYVVLFLLVLLPSGLDASINVTCPGGWTMNRMNSKCYKLFSAKKTWNEAKTACGNEGAKLAELKDFSTNDFIRAKFGGKAWIGCYRCGEDTCYLNNDYVPYTPYAPHEPDMKSDQQSTNQTEKENDFAIVIRPDGRWADEPKHIRYSYICEVDGWPSSPCRANENCSRINNNTTYRCHVGFFWNESSCTTEDGCLSSTCRANENCSRINNSTCRCHVGFFWNGSSCTTEGFSALKFRGDDTTQYGISKGSRKILKAFTVCFWLSLPKHYVRKHTPTPFSYATKGSSWGNDITLSVEPTLVVILNSHYFRTNVTVADGKPHYICVTWESLSGLLQVFKDGVCVKEMNNSRKGDGIKAGGTWVIGQDQDSFGGGFQKRDSFQGTLTEVNVWNTVLCAYEISRIAKDCGLLVKGNYKTLSDFTLYGVEFLMPKFPCCPKVNASCSY